VWREYRFRRLRPGDTLFEETVGEVLSAPTGCGLSPGDKVLHNLGWREFAAVPVCDCTLLDDTLPDVAAHLGHGWTAYAALTRGVRILPGDTVFVTSAAGAIGSMAGQVARLLGAGRVIGSTSSQEKATRLVSELGYDSAIVRAKSRWRLNLPRLRPMGWTFAWIWSAVRNCRPPSRRREPGLASSWSVHCQGNLPLAGHGQDRASTA
jgi:NADPH-dependent curcumin reductase CurA